MLPGLLIAKQITKYEVKSHLLIYNLEYNYLQLKSRVHTASAVELNVARLPPRVVQISLAVSHFAVD